MVTANAATSPYGGPLPTFGWTISGFRNGDSSAVVTGAASLTTTATAASPVGTYPITVTAGTLAASNYAFTSFVNGTLTVTKAHLTVTANATSTTYGSLPTTLGATITGFVNGDTASVVSGAPSLSTTATAASGIGTYPITVALGTLAAANYDFPTFKAGTLTITKAHLTVTAEPLSDLYGGPIPSLTVVDQRIRGERQRRRRLRQRRRGHHGDPVQPGRRLPDHGFRGHADGSQLRLSQPGGWHAHGEQGPPDRDGKPRHECLRGTDPAALCDDQRVSQRRRPRGRQRQLRS